MISYDFCRQKSYLTIATGWADAAASPGRNARPAEGVTPTTGKKLSLTRLAKRICAGAAGLAATARVVRRYAGKPLNERLLSRRSREEPLVQRLGRVSSGSYRVDRGNRGTTCLQKDCR